MTSAVAQADSLTMLAVSSAGAWQVTTPLLDRTFTGSGDLTVRHVPRRTTSRPGDPGLAVGRTADIVYSVLKATTDAGSSELLLVGAQDEIVHPSHHFEVQQHPLTPVFQSWKTSILAPRALRRFGRSS